MSDENHRKRTYWRIGALIIALGLVSLILFQFVLAEEIPVKSNCEDDELVVLRTMLADMPTANVQGRKLIEGKIEMFERMAAICETITPATVNPNETPQFIPWTPPPFTTGIFEGQPGAYFHAFEAKIENHWKGIINGNRVFVFAGAWVDDPNQGFIAVKTAPSKGQSVWSYYPSATKSGALRIVDVKGSRLIIQQANDEKKLYFDVPAMSFVGSLSEMVVQSTPTEILNTVQTTVPPYPAP